MLSHAPSPRRTILIVDPDDSFRVNLAGLLTEAGYECLETASEGGARTVLDSGQDVSAVLCAIGMPGGSGIAPVAQLSADFPDVGVIMMTDVDDLETARLAFEVSADG